nr:hypothetical protein [Chloroflexota bacterium]
MRNKYAKVLVQRVLPFLVVFALLSPTCPLSVCGQFSYTGYGTNIASAVGARKTAELGFQWVRIYYPDQVEEAERYGLKALLLLGWEFPLSDVQSWGNAVYDIVRRYRGRIAAYQICNEPNLAEMWHKPRHADPAEYVAYLREAYLRAKQADPACIIVSAGLAVNGGVGELAMDDVQFLRGMYAAGAKPYFDVLGAHPYGFGYAPEDASSNPIHCFRRVEQYRAVMVQYGDATKSIWLTEFGWIIDPGQECYDYDGWPSRWWQRVSAQTQADYLVRACRYARTNWPWVGVMFVWNLDYNLVPWNDYCDQKSWFAILNHDGSPRPAYWALANMVREQATPTPTKTATHTPMPFITSTPGSSTNTGTVTGRILLQGRENHQGTLVSVNGYHVRTSMDGAFRLEGVPVGTQELVAQIAGYLRYRNPALTVRENGETVVSDIQLLAGDINSDNIVNLFDLVMIAGRYDARATSSAPEDVNGDGVVNLFDLVLASRNYGRRGS